MPRLLRIALTLMVSATVLIFLVVRRHQRLEADQVRGLTAEAIASETQMITLGAAIAAAMILGGLALLVTSLVRKRPGSDG